MQESETGSHPVRNQFQSTPRRGGRGRGRGRGGRLKQYQQVGNDLNSGGSTAKQKSDKPELTHFLCVPLGHLPGVRSVAESFNSALLAHSPSITGLDSTIIVSPRRLHFTLGVMSLEEGDTVATSNADQETRSKKTVTSALAHLRTLRPQILSALDGYALRVPLTAIDIMKPERNDTTRAHVLFAGPSVDDLRSADGQRLKRVCELINTEFNKAGFIVDGKRPLKLHCTLINTSHRKPRPKGGYARRVSFSFAEICDSSAVRTLVSNGEPTGSGPQFQGSSSSQASETLASVQGTKPMTVNAGQKVRSYAVPVNFGTHAVSEIQICRMGSWGPEGEYVCIGKIGLNEEIG